MSDVFSEVITNMVGGGAPGAEAAPSSAAPESVSTNSEQSDIQAKPTESQTPAEQLADLDKLQRVRLGGKELTVKELKDSLLRHSDYSKKTKEVAEARKYAENFVYDFKSVLANPSLIAQFKQIYPKQYVEQVEAYLSEQSGAANADQEQVTDTQQLPPEVKAILEKFKQYEPKFEKLDAWETNVKEQETRAIVEQLDTLHERYGSKYPLADPDLVDFRVQMAKEKGVEITKDNLNKVYESVYKSLHEKQKSLSDKQIKTKNDEQVKAGQTARDVGGGAGIIANPPKKYSKISEITADALSRFGGK